MYKWTKIQHTELAKKVQGLYYVNLSKGMIYHNFAHVLSLYEYLHSIDFPYNEALDWAILFHDVVYDEKPDKELRSAQLWLELSGHAGTVFGTEVYDLIMATKDHDEASTIDPLKSAIIRADLHGLANPITTFYNFEKIMRESMMLYGIDHATFAKNSEDFMIGLYQRVTKNKILDIEHEDFYQEVLKGITSTVVLARIIRGN